MLFCQYKRYMFIYINKHQREPSKITVWLYPLIADRDVLVSVWPLMLMDEANSMTDLMNRGTHILATILQSHWLLTALHTHIGPAAARTNVGTLYTSWQHAARAIRLQHAAEMAEQSHSGCCPQWRCIYRAQWAMAHHGNVHCTTVCHSRAKVECSALQQCTYTAPRHTTAGPWHVTAMWVALT